MQFNVEWLKKWVAVELDAESLAARLTVVDQHHTLCSPR